jgi:pyruvate/2-oxoacid:ferredoxin oxidoreductase beta subunit
MKDKDLLVVIAEMLRKQDQHTEILTNQSILLEKSYETLTAFMDVSVKQFEQQQFNEKFLGQFEQQRNFNEKFLELNEKIADRLEKIEKKL